MKIRSGFVSNSSSSSFLIYGTELTPKLEEALEAKYGDEDFDVYDIMEKEDLRYYPETEFGTVVGIDFTDMGEDETPRQFKARVKTKLEEVFGVPINDCDTMGGEYAC